MIRLYSLSPLFPRRSVLFAVSLMLSFNIAFPSDLTLLRQRLRETVTLGTLDYSEEEPQMRAYLNDLAEKTTIYQRSMRRDTSFLWDDCNLLTRVPAFTPFHVHYSYMRLHTMARAWAYHGTPFYHDPQLLDDIRFALELLYRVAYNENTPMCGNWWEWRIGNTWDYANIVSILYDQLTTTELQHFEKGASRHVRDYAKTGNLTYANQADICLNLIMIGLLTDNEQDVYDGIRCAVPAFVDKTTPQQRALANLSHDSIIREQRQYRHNTIVWKKEGLYPDGTFIQHVAIPYIGTYGKQMANLLSIMLRLFHDTGYQIPKQIIDVVPTWVTRTYLPAIYRGEMMLMFMGRGNARDPYRNARQCVLDLLDCASLIKDSALHNRVVSECADMIAFDSHYPSPYSNIGELPVNKPRVDAALELADKNYAQQPFSLFLAAGDRLIHQTDNYRFALAMSSNRIGKYEAFIRPTKSENTTGWYTGDGMTYIYTPFDPFQYKQYVPRVNPYKIPGTTVDLLPREPCASNMILFDSQPAAADVARAGGVTMNGMYVSAMMQLLASRSDLKARKSWFCFDNEIVCLGSAITLTDDREVITTVENRQYNRRLTLNGTQLANNDTVVENVKYAWLDSTGAYFFPKPVTLHTAVSERGYNEMWLSHGNAPYNASYEYVLLPSMTEQDAGNYARRPDVTVLRNDTAVHAVYDRVSGITAINFWQKATVAGVTADAMTALMMRQQGDSLLIAVAEPTWLRDTLSLTIDGYGTTTLNTRLMQGTTQQICLPRQRKCKHKNNR